MPSIKVEPLVGSSRVCENQQDRKSPAAVNRPWGGWRPRGIGFRVKPEWLLQALIS